MTEDMRRETKPDMRKGVQVAVPSAKGKEAAVDRRTIERPTQQPVERKG